MSTADLKEPTVHDPATYWMAYHLTGEGRTVIREFARDSSNGDWGDQEPEEGAS